jgi:hypothetical protein
VGFVVDKVALGQVFLRVLQLFPTYHSTVDELIYHLGDKQQAAVQRQSHPVHMNDNNNNKRFNFNSFHAIYVRESSLVKGLTRSEACNFAALHKK